MSNYAFHVTDFTDRKERAYAVIEQTAGPLEWQDEDWALGRLDGAPLWVQRVYIDGRHEAAFHLAAPCHRPIDLKIYTRANTYGVGPEVRTGDAAFDAAYIVNGAPVEVVAAVLDDAMRAEIVAIFPGEQPPIEVGHDGFVKVLRFMPASHEVERGVFAQRPITVEELTAKGRLVQRLAKALAERFDAVRADIARAQGEDAAVAWVERLTAARRAEAAHRARMRRIFFAIPVVLFVGTFALAFAILVLFFVLSALIP